MNKILKTLPLAAFIVGILTEPAYANSQATDSSTIVNRLIDKAISLKQSDPLTPDWLQRVEVELDINSESKPIYSMATVQPLFQTYDKTHTVFTQVRFAHDTRDRNTGNFGLGYRNLAFNQKVIFGANGFFDYEWPYAHQRAGGGIEVISSAIELRSNLYKGLSDWHSAAINTQERPLDGIDVELGMQIPYLPWAYLFGKHSEWNGVQDVKGHTVSMRLNPVAPIEVEVGHSDDDASDKSQFAKVKYKVNWGGSSSKRKIRLIDDKPFRLNENVDSKLLDKVRRENNIRVEKRIISGSEAGTVTVSVARGN